MELTLTELALIFLAVALAGGIGWLLRGRKSGAAMHEKETRLIELETQLDSEQKRRERAEESQLQMQNQQAKVLEELHEQLRKDNAESAATIARLQANLENAQQQAQEKIDLLQKARETMTAEFKTLSQSILDENSKKFGDDSKKLLTPLAENLESFRKRVDEIHTAETTERASLKTEIKNLHENAMKIGNDANNLALALKGNSKTQGGWGEEQLAALLEKSGLHKGEGYELQKTLYDDKGKWHIADAVINLPDERNFVIDSKISLNAFTDAMNADNDADKQESLKSHVLAIRKHVSDLAAKDYQNLNGINAPDMIFMFMAVEPALIEALVKDPNLFNDAYKKNVVLCSPMNLMPILRSTELVWQMDKQNRNAKDIAYRGGLLFDKFHGFVKNLEEVGAELDKALAAYKSSYKQLSNGPGNLITQANQLRELGINTKKEKLTVEEE